MDGVKGLWAAPRDIKCKKKLCAGFLDQGPILSERFWAHARRDRVTTILSKSNVKGLEDRDA